MPRIRMSINNFPDHNFPDRILEALKGIHNETLEQDRNRSGRVVGAGVAVAAAFAHTGAMGPGTMHDYSLVFFPFFDVDQQAPSEWCENRNVLVDKEGRLMHCELRRTGCRNPSTGRACAPSWVAKSSVSYAFFAAAIASAAMIAAKPARAEAPPTTVAYQPMVSTGMAARQPFEAWFVFDKSSDPVVPGYAVPAGATIRFTFPKAFTPKPGGFLGVVMLTGWSQGSIPAKFSTVLDDKNPRTVVVRFNEGIAAGPAERPGLKAIHLRTNEINPAKVGDYPITIQFIDAGPLSGTTKPTAHITAHPIPNVAAYNQLHQSKDEDWQRVKPGEDAPLPIDFLVTLPDASRSVISLKAGDAGLSILKDGKPIGSITAQGVPVALTPQAFGPGYSRLGIIEVHAKAGSTPGVAQIVASLDGGTRYTIHLVVEGL
jgi:hypothetical protein